MDSDLDRTVAQSIDRREDFPCDLGGKSNAAAIWRCGGTMRIGSVRPAGHVGPSVAAPPRVVMIGSIVMFNIRMTTIAAGHYQ